MTARRLLPAVIVMSFMAVAANADDGCKTFGRTMSHFHGTVVAVKTLAEYSGTVIDVDSRALFAVTIRVDSVEPGVTAPKAGEVLTFALHSPSRTLGISRSSNRSLDLEAERMDCNGAFWHFNTLRLHTSTPVVEPFTGDLEVGHTYRAAVTKSSEGLALAQSLNLPEHYREGDVSFLNAGEFASRAAHEIVFDVVSVRVTRSGDWEFSSVYDARITAAK